MSCDNKAFPQFSKTLKAKPQEPKWHVPYYQYLPLWWTESLAHINTGLRRCVSFCIYVGDLYCPFCVLWVRSATKCWDKSRQSFHSAGIKPSFYSKLDNMTTANCNALRFQEQRHLLLRWMLFSIFFHHHNPWISVFILWIIKKRICIHTLGAILKMYLMAELAL